MKLKKSRLKKSAINKPYTKVINVVYKVDTKQLKYALYLAEKLEKTLKNIKK